MKKVISVRENEESIRKANNEGLGKVKGFEYSGSVL